MAMDSFNLKIYKQDIETQTDIAGSELDKKKNELSELNDKHLALLES